LRWWRFCRSRLREGRLGQIHMSAGAAGVEVEGAGDGFAGDVEAAADQQPTAVADVGGGFGGGELDGAAEFFAGFIDAAHFEQEIA